MSYRTQPQAQSAAPMNADRAVETLRPADGGPTDLRWPDVFLIGLAKTGTSSLHECLTSDVFAKQACCVGAKELRLFRFPAPREPNATAVLEMHARLQRQWRGPGRSRRPPWPTRDRPGPYQRVLDFTPGYLPDVRVPLELRRVYGDVRSRRLRFIVVLRDVAARTRSHYCMAAPNAKQLRELFHTPVSLPSTSQSWALPPWLRIACASRPTVAPCAGNVCAAPGALPSRPPLVRRFHDAQSERDAQVHRKGVWPLRRVPPRELGGALRE